MMILKVVDDEDEQLHGYTTVEKNSTIYLSVVRVRDRSLRRRTVGGGRHVGQPLQDAADPFLVVVHLQVADAVWMHHLQKKNRSAGWLS